MINDEVPGHETEATQLILQLIQRTFELLQEKTLQLTPAQFIWNGAVDRDCIACTMLVTVFVSLHDAVSEYFCFFMKE